MNTNINTIGYWNNRFDGEDGLSDWELCNGCKQSEDFMKGILKNIPKAILKDMSNGTILDYGCALGDGTKVLVDDLANSWVFGYDFSDVAIDKAKIKQFDTSIEFDDKINVEAKYDYVICSHVLQCVDNVDKTLEELMNITNKALFILVPNEDNGLEEHYNIFKPSYFKAISGFKKKSSRVIKTDSWAYNHILVRYEKDVK